MRLVVLILALLLDRFVGEYPNRWHPVVWMGTLLRAAERRAPAVGERAQLRYGLGMALILPTLWAAVGWGVSAVPVLDVIGGALLLKACFAIRALERAGATVADAVDAHDLPAARAGLRSLCSRDPEALGFDQLVAGATESIAENASDSIVAPLFWYVLLGLPGVAFYRAANTADAMIGYHGRYEWLGKAAARLDDLLNLVPARLTAAFLLAGGAVVGADAAAGWRVMWRDAPKTESPNAGWPMAAMAGLLGVVLEKPGHYRLGDPGAALTGETLRQGWKVVGAALVVGALVAASLTAVGGAFTSVWSVVR